jgi:hypothetical protein
MSMTCSLHRVAPAAIDRLLTDPARAREILSADDDNWEISRPKGLVGFLLRLTPLSIETATRKRPEAPDYAARLAETECDLDTAWHGLHYLFTGTAWDGDAPACFLVSGGEEVGDSDFDSPPRLLPPEQVREFGGFLGSLSDDELRRRHDPDRMTALGIYPEQVWLRPASPDESSLGYLLESFAEMKALVDKAAAAGDGLLIYLA